jgi:hypothetical protein
MEAPTSSQQSLLETLPTDLMQRIFHCVGSVQDLSSCTMTCKELYEALRQDSMWITAPARHFTCENAPNMTHRERACLQRAYYMAWKEQGKRSTKPIISSMLWPDIDEHSWFFITELVEANLIAMLQALQRFLSVTFHPTCCRLEFYPPLDLSLLRHFAEYLRNPLSIIAQIPSCQAFFLLKLLNDVDLTTGRIDDCSPTVDRAHKDAIIRRLAFRAGILKLGPDVYNIIWKWLVTITSSIVQGVDVVTNGETPPSVLARELEATALRAGLPISKVYWYDGVYDDDENAAKFDDDDLSMSDYTECSEVTLL